VKKDEVVPTSDPAVPTSDRTILTQKMVLSEYRPRNPFSPNAPHWSAKTQLGVFGRSAP